MKPIITCFEQSGDGHNLTKSQYYFTKDRSQSTCDKISFTRLLPAKCLLSTTGLCSLTFAVSDGDLVREDTHGKNQVQNLAGKERLEILRKSRRPSERGEDNKQSGIATLPMPMTVK